MGTEILSPYSASLRLLGYRGDKQEINVTKYLKLRDGINSEGEDAYATCEYISLNNQDIKEHDMRFLMNDAGFNMDSHEFFVNGLPSPSLSSPYPFDSLLSRLLHEETQKVK